MTILQINVHKRLLIVAISLAAFAAAAQPQLVPPDMRLNEQARKALPKSAETLQRAGVLAQGARPTVPDVGKVSAGGIQADPSAVAKRYAELNGRKEPQLFIAVSMSLPPETLLRLSQQAARIGAHLVLRGVIESSLVKTVAATGQYTKRVPGLQIDIDPTAFKRFGINQVPTFVMSRATEGDRKPCVKECDASGTFVSVVGDVSLDYALEHIALNAGTPYKARAEQLLAQYRSKTR